MVIRREDRVAAVLAHDESLIDVFVDVAPAFQRLRNPALRKVMARLVTVEQAARIAGVDPDALVARLNGGAGVPHREPMEADAAAAAGTRAQAPHPAPGSKPSSLSAIPPERIVEVDVREDLRAGREPFSRIMAARRAVPDGGALCVRAIFEPVPLYAVMAKQGLAHHTEQRADDDWVVWFHPEAALEAVRAHDAPAGGPEPEDPSGHVVVLDVRGLEPPEPMVRTLAALDALPPGGTLVQLNVRVPQFLLPRLAERGFRYEIREQRADLVRILIFRADEAEGPHTTDRNEA